jgi:hypothetical protein
MAPSINLVTLRSRRIDLQLTAQRRIQSAAAAGGGLVQSLAGKLKRFGGWAIGGLMKFFPQLNFASLWDIAVNAYFAIKEFDWNKADKELEDQIKSNNKALVTQAARTIGEQAGIGSVRLVNGFVGKFLPGNKGKQLQAVEGIKIPVLSRRIGIALAREQGTQLRNDTMVFLESATRALISNGLASMLLHARKQEWFGLKPVTGPTTDGSLNRKIEKKIETLPKDWQQPATAFLDGFESGIIQAGYVIANEADDAVEEMRYAREERKANQEIITVEVWPEGEAKGEEDEPLRFVGRQDEVIEAINNVLPTYDQLTQPRGFLSPPIQLETVKGNPIVIFNFVETRESQQRRKGKSRKEMRASFRIMSERFESTTDKSKIDALGLKIRTQFPKSFRHKVGADSWAYTDRTNGYALKISAISEAEAKTLARKLLASNLTPVPFDASDWTRGRTKDPKTKTKAVLGKRVVVSNPKDRIEVSLRQVDLSISGWGSQVLLYRPLV